LACDGSWASQAHFTFSVAVNGTEQKIDAKQDGWSDPEYQPPCGHSSKKGEVHRSNETQAQPRLRGTQVAAPGSTLATLDIQENDAV
jgi:hypothetical protein